MATRGGDMMGILLGGILVYIYILYVYLSMYVYIYVYLCGMIHPMSNMGIPLYSQFYCLWRTCFFQPMDEWGTRCSDIPSAGQKKNADAYNVRPPSYKLVYKPQ